MISIVINTFATDKPVDSQMNKVHLTLQFRELTDSVTEKKRDKNLENHLQ